MADEWQIKHRGKIIGPVTSSQLKKLVEAGKIKRKTAIRAAENSVWIVAECVQGLFKDAPDADDSTFNRNDKPFIILKKDSEEGGVNLTKPRSLTLHVLYRRPSLPQIILGTFMIAILFGVFGFMRLSESTKELLHALFMLSLVAIPCVLFYLIPTIIAIFRGHPNMAAIMAVNFLLGWTFLGWVAALVWSVTAIESRVQMHYHKHH